MRRGQPLNRMRTNLVCLKGKYFGPKKNDEGEFEVRTNEELRRLFGDERFIGIVKSSRISQVLGNVTT